jgi:hypothetical protein
VGRWRVGAIPNAYLAEPTFQVLVGQTLSIKARFVKDVGKAAAHGKSTSFIQASELGFRPPFADAFVVVTLAATPVFTAHWYASAKPCGQLTAFLCCCSQQPWIVASVGLVVARPRGCSADVHTKRFLVDERAREPRNREVDNE